MLLTCVQVYFVRPRAGWVCGWAGNNNEGGICFAYYRCSEFGGWWQLQPEKRQGDYGEYFSRCKLPRHVGAIQPRWADK